MIKRRLIFLICLLLILLPLFIVSCDNTTVNNSKGQVEIIQDPVIENVEEVEGIRVITTTNVSKYLYSMIPQWTHTGSVEGSTEGINTTINGTLYQNYRAVDAGTSLGYFAQGKWHLKLYLLDDNDNLIIADPIIDSDYYLNTISNPINFSLGDILFDSNKTCKLSIDNIKFDLVEESSKYGSDKDYYLETRLKPLDGSSSSTLVISARNISFEKNTQSRDVVGVINNCVVDNALSYGSYVLSIVLMERKDTSFVEAGGTTFSFLAARDNCVITSTSDNIIHILPADYVTPGAGSGIEIESGIPSSVNVKAYKGVVSEGTLVSSTVSVTTKDTVILVPEVTNGPSSISTYKWFVDGVEQTGTAIDSNGYLTLKLTTAKTYTITYMFLDGTNYNTISGNYYLTVNAAT